MANIPVFDIPLDYSTHSEPDHAALGKIVDDEIKKHFMGMHIVMRSLGSGAHSDKSLDEMIEIIKHNGHDRYDPDRVGDRYDNLENKPIEIFAFDFIVDKSSEMFAQYSYGFYHFGAKNNGVPIHLDIIIIYDFNQLNQVHFTYEGRESEGQRSDGWTFKHPEKKSDSILAIIKLII